VVKIFKPKVVRECDMNFAVDEALADQAVDKLFHFITEKEPA